MGDPMTELQGVTRHMGSRKRTHPALTPASEGWCSIYLPRKDGRLSCTKLSVELVGD